MSFYVYMLKSVEKKPVTYVGYTKDLVKRIKLHNNNKGAKFTRGRKWKPYKENFSPIYPGAVSLFVNDTTKISEYRKYITIYGNTDYKNIFNLKYKNIPLKKNIFQSQSKKYVEEFIKLEKKK